MNEFFPIGDKRLPLRDRNFASDAPDPDDEGLGDPTDEGLGDPDDSDWDNGLGDPY